jgi:hypothetical protein
VRRGRNIKLMNTFRITLIRPILVLFSTKPMF